MRLSLSDFWTRLQLLWGLYILTDSMNVVQNPTTNILVRAYDKLSFFVVFLKGMFGLIFCLFLGVKSNTNS